MASQNGEQQLADVLASEQLAQRIREGAHATLQDVFAGDELVRAQPSGELGPGLGMAVDVSEVSIPVIDARAAINSR